MHPAALFALAFLAFGAVACVFRPAWVVPYFAFVIYARLPDTLRAEYGIPPAFMFLAPALIALALARRMTFGEPLGKGWKSGLWWLCAWGVVCGASFLYALDPGRTAETLKDYLDAVLIVLIVTFFLRERAQLEPLVWSLIGAGVFLGILTIHQNLTGNWTSTYGGFAHVELRNIVGRNEGLRAEGPVSANYFALILVALVPLAVDRLLHASGLWLRVLAGAALVVLVGAVGATYSRGGFLTLAAMGGLLLFLTPRWPKVLLATAVIAVVAIPFLPEGYRERMSSFGQVWDGLRGRHVEDTAIRGRLSEVRSAAMMFGDHPLLGVGTGHYELHYTSYARRLGLDGRREERQAHSLYLEVAAENGLLGLAVFGSLLSVALVGMVRTRRGFAREGDLASAHLVTGLTIGFAGYLMGSVFLHLSYPRFFWILVGVAMAVRALAPPLPAVEPAFEQPDFDPEPEPEPAPDGGHPACG